MFSSNGRANTTLPPTALAHQRTGFVLTEELHTALSILNLVTSLSGTVANGLNIAVFANMGTKESINISLLGLAVSDVMVCFLTLLSAVLEIPFIGKEISERFEISVIEVNYMIFMIPLVFFARITIVLTALITVERCLCVALPLKVKTIVTRSRISFCVISSFVLVGLWTIPSYYLHRFGRRFNPYVNKTTIGLVLASDYDVINSWYTPIDAAIFYVVLYTLIIICTASLSINLKKKLNWRRKATATKISINAGDDNKAKDEQSSSSTKEMRIAKMVVSISLLFIVCYSPSVAVWVSKTLDSSFRLQGSKAHLLILCGILSFFTQSLNSGVNIFIYYKNSSNYRETFHHIFFSSGKS